MMPPTRVRIWLPFSFCRACNIEASTTLVVCVTHSFMQCLFSSPPPGTCPHSPTNVTTSAGVPPREKTYLCKLASYDAQVRVTLSRSVRVYLKGNRSCNVWRCTSLYLWRLCVHVWSAEQEIDIVGKTAEWPLVNTLRIKFSITSASLLEVVPKTMKTSASTTLPK